MRHISAILISIILSTAVIYAIVCVQAESEVTIYVDGSGVATVTLFIEATPGMNTINLPIEPLEPTVEVVCTISKFHGCLQMLYSCTFMWRMLVVQCKLCS
ncbi:MAG: hypothetical protein QXJ56_05635 [Ignisphaera sp.]